MPEDNTPSTRADEHTEHCLQILADAQLAVQAHSAFISAHREEVLFSPRDVSFITQQREHFIEQLQIFGTHIDNLIAHQQALFKVFHDIPIDPNTGLPRHHTGVPIIAFRVPAETICRDTPVRSAVTSPVQHSRFSYYAVRRGHSTGVFQSWEAAREQVHGFPNNEHRGFNNLNDAWAYIHGIPPSPFPASPE
jgi:hypothetical protein